MSDPQGGGREPNTPQRREGRPQPPTNQPRFHMFPIPIWGLTLSISRKKKRKAISTEGDLNLRLHIRGISPFNCRYLVSLSPCLQTLVYSAQFVCACVVVVVAAAAFIRGQIGISSRDDDRGAQHGFVCNLALLPSCCSSCCCAALRACIFPWVQEAAAAGEREGGPSIIFSTRRHRHTLLSY